MKKKRAILISIFVFIFTFVMFKFAEAKEKPASVAKKPERLLFMVFDQMRSDYIDRYNLKNFKRLRKLSADFKNGYVGHMSSVTVVSHAVMTTGLLPKQLPWSESYIVDTDGLFGEKDKVLKATDLETEQYLNALKQMPKDNFLVYKLKNKLNKKQYAIGQKHYAVAAMGGPYADSLIYINKSKKVCAPEGVNVPDYILKNERYKINCEESIGAELSFYPMEGHRYFPGHDQKKLGGDIWIADMALDIMNNDTNWGGMYLTFGAIDRFGHMLGETDYKNTHAFKPPASLEEIIRIADQQLGKILDHLEKNNLLKSTMIVLTADHGAQTNEIYLGNTPNKDGGFWAQRIFKLAPIKLMSNDTAMRLWLKEVNPQTVQQASLALQEISQVTEIFYLNKSKMQYESIFNRLDKQSPKYKAWAKKHHLELVNTFANKNAPDLVAALADDAGFGRLGDHGGMQEKVQRIPILIKGVKLNSGFKSEALRLFEIKQIILKEFGIK